MRPQSQYRRVGDVRELRANQLRRADDNGDERLGAGLEQRLGCAGDEGDSEQVSQKGFVTKAKPPRGTLPMTRKRTRSLQVIEGLVREPPSARTPIGSPSKR